MPVNVTQQRTSAVAIVLRCSPCAHVRHQDCTRGPCCCSQCRAADIIAIAKNAAENSNSTAMLRYSLARLLAVVAQKQAADRRRVQREDKMVSCVRCGQLTRSRWDGRPKRWCSKRCKNAAYSERRRQRERLAVIPDQNRKTQDTQEIQPETIYVRGRTGPSRPAVNVLAGVPGYSGHGPFGGFDSIEAERAWYLSTVATIRDAVSTCLSRGSAS